jgi:hypothetical protein
VDGTAFEVAVGKLDTAFNRECAACEAIPSYDLTDSQGGLPKIFGSPLAPAPIQTEINQFTTRVVIPFIPDKIN